MHENGTGCWHWHSTNTHPTILCRHSSMQRAAETTGKMLSNRLYVSNLWPKQMDFSMLLSILLYLPHTSSWKSGASFAWGLWHKTGLPYFSCHPSSLLQKLPRYMSSAHKCPSWRHLPVLHCRQEKDRFWCLLQFECAVGSCNALLRCNNLILCLWPKILVIGRVICM